MKVRGNALVIPDNIDTDQILPGKYLHLDRDKLGKYALSGYDTKLAEKISAGDILVAGKNIGLGSGREEAPISIKLAGIEGIVAESFSRIFYRNCINIGLPVINIELITKYVDNGDDLLVDFNDGIIKNFTKDKQFKGNALPEFLQDIIKKNI